MLGIITRTQQLIDKIDLDSEKNYIMNLVEDFKTIQEKTAIQIKTDLLSEKKQRLIDEWDRLNSLLLEKGIDKTTISQIKKEIIIWQ